MIKAASLFLQPSPELLSTFQLRSSLSLQQSSIRKPALPQSNRQTEPEPIASQSHRQSSFRATARATPSFRATQSFRATARATFAKLARATKPPCQAPPASSLCLQSRVAFNIRAPLSAAGLFFLRALASVHTHTNTLSDALLTTHTLSRHFRLTCPSAPMFLSKAPSHAASAKCILSSVPILNDIVPTASASPCPTFVCHSTPRYLNPLLATEGEK